MDSVWVISHWDLTIRIFLAAGLGGLIGLEREWSNHAAGLRTHILVCIGSASIMLLSIYGFTQFVPEANVRTDPARLAAQVISGIGFLGAGAIMRNGSMVSGLTTAASIWVVAAIGLCVGAGFFYVAGLATVLVLLSLFVLNKWEKYWMRNRQQNEVMVKIIDRPGSLGRIASQFGIHGIQIVSMNMRPEERKPNVEDEDAVMELRFRLKAVSVDKMSRAIEDISMTGDVISIDYGSWGQVNSIKHSVSQAV
jgi:putative Mg2+ transporter-C (MgtC) family protein